MYTLTPVQPGDDLPLSDADAATPDDFPSKKELEPLTEERYQRLADLQSALVPEGKHAVLVVLQGRDASGKDGAIRNVFSACNPQGCQVTSFKAPSELELEHDFLWRVHAATPRLGTIGIFNRSHYEDVLIARVRGLVPQDVWQRRYAHIVAFERLLADSGVLVLKFFLHISRAEQAQRLRDRIEEPKKRWKFDPGDLDDRAQWDDYTAAYRDALRWCSTPTAPWYVVPADNKGVRNYLVTDAIVRALEQLDLAYPSPDPELLAAWEARLDEEVRACEEITD